MYGEDEISDALFGEVEIFHTVRLPLVVFLFGMVRLIHHVELCYLYTYIIINLISLSYIFVSQAMEYL